MSLFNLFSRPKVDKLRGYTEPNYATLPRPSSRASKPASRNSSSQALLVPRPVTPHEPPTSLAQLPEDSDQTVTKASPSYLSYSQACYESIKTLTTYTSNADASSGLRLQRNRASVLDLSSGLNGHDHGRSHRGSMMGGSGARKTFILTKSAVLYQFSDSGPADRLPERLLLLTKDSVAIASDLVPGKPYVIQVAQAMNAQGATAAPSTSLFTKLGLRGASSRRMATSMLLVVENAKELEQWLFALRHEIELLGGYMDFSKALQTQRDAGLRQEAKQAKRASRMSQMSMMPQQRLEQGQPAIRRSHIIASTNSSRTPSIRSPALPSPKSPLMPAPSPGFKLAKKHSTRTINEEHDSHNALSALATEEAKPRDSLSPATDVVEEIRESASGVPKDEETGQQIEKAIVEVPADTEPTAEPPVTPQAEQPPSHTLLETPKRQSFSRVYHVPSNGPFRSMNSFQNMPTNLPPTISEDMQESPVRGTSSSQPWDTPKRSPIRRVSPLPVRVDNKTIQRSSSQALPSTRTDGDQTVRRYSSTSFHLPLKINPSPPRQLKTEERLNAQKELTRTDSVHPPQVKQDENAAQTDAVIHELDSVETPVVVDKSSGKEEFEPTAAPANPDGGPTSNPSSATSPLPGELPAFPFKVRSPVSPIGSADQTKQTPQPRPTGTFSLFPSATPVRSPPSSPRLRSPSMETLNQQRPLRRPASLQIRPSQAALLSNIRSASATNTRPGRASAVNHRLNSSHSTTDLRSAAIRAPEPKRETATEGFSRPAQSVVPSKKESESRTDLAERKESTSSIRPASPSTTLRDTFQSLPQLDFGMPLVALAPPPPPPMSPLPQLPAVNRSMTSVGY